MSHPDCRCDLIASSEVGHVALCDCGHVHVTLQYLTVRLEPDAFCALANMIGQAQTRITCAAATSTAILPGATTSGLH